MRIITLLGFVKKEFRQLRRDKFLLRLIFLIPVAQTLIFGLAIRNEVRNIEFSVISRPQSQIAQSIAAHARASGWFKVTLIESSYPNPADLITARRAEAVLVEPKEGFEAALARFGGGVGNGSAFNAANAADTAQGAVLAAASGGAQLLINASNAARARQAEAYIRNIIQRAQEELYPNSPASARGGLIELSARMMFNPSLKTSYFMIPAIMVIGTFIVLTVVVSMGMTREKENGTMEKLIGSPSSAGEILLGKNLLYFGIGIFLIFFILAMGRLGFGVPLRGHAWQIALNGIIFVFSALSVGVFISAVAQNQRQAMMGCMLFLLPSVLLSGVIFPVANIDAHIRWICYFNPLMYSVTNFRNIILKGGDLAYFWEYCFVSSFICAVFLFLAYKNFKMRLN